MGLKTVLMGFQPVRGRDSEGIRNLGHTHTHLHPVLCSLPRAIHPPMGPYPPPHQPPPGYQGYFNHGQQPYYPPPPPPPYEHCHHHCGDEGSGVGFLQGW
uniref:Uncharacterized protein n=1 Tax=Oryza brachyantha TaxID=4533 RepID=J3MUT2_ORYBR